MLTALLAPHETQTLKALKKDYILCHKEINHVQYKFAYVVNI